MFVLPVWLFEELCDSESVCVIRVSRDCLYKWKANIGFFRFGICILYEMREASVCIAYQHFNKSMGTKKRKQTHLFFFEEEAIARMRSKRLYSILLPSINPHMLMHSFLWQFNCYWLCVWFFVWAMRIKFYGFDFLNYSRGCCISMK